MRPAEARDYFRKLVKSYFAKANVIYGRQSHAAKTGIPLVSLTSGNVKRSRDDCGYDIDGIPIYCYPSSMNITIDLFTHGTPVVVSGETVAHDNTAIDEMTAFADFLGSRHVVEWCNRYDMSISIDGDAQDLTALVNDTAYEYRSRLSVWLNFVQTAVGNAALLSEQSIQYPTGIIDPETGAAAYAPHDPETSATEPDENTATIIPYYYGSTHVGGSEELAAEDAHFFEAAVVNSNDKEESHEQQL